LPLGEHETEVADRKGIYNPDKHLRSLVLNIPGAVYRRECAAPRKAPYVSDQVESLTGYPASDFTSGLRSFDALVCSEDRDRVGGVVEQVIHDGGAFSLEYRLITADGNLKWVVEHGRAVVGPNGQPAWIDGVILDLSAQNKAEELDGRAKARAGYDALTFLPDSTLVRDRLQQMLLRSQRSRQLVATFLVNIDNFKLINDNMSRRTGDEVLMAVVERLAGVLRPSDTLGRQGEDEFAILVDGLSPTAGPELLAKRLLEALSAPLCRENADDVPICVTASIGIATNESHEPNDLLRDAAIALRQAKAKGGNCHVQFTPTMKSVEMQRLELETDLCQALRENQFFVLYQPIVELDTLVVRGVNALLRWRHPVRGIVEPKLFMPVLEDTEMIVSVGPWLLKQACRQASAWRRLGHPLTVSVQAAPVQVAHEDFVDYVAEALSSSSLEPRSLMIDLVGFDPSMDSARLVEPLRETKKVGARVAVHVTDASASTIDQLRLLPLDEIRMDQSIIGAMSESFDAISYVRALAQLGQELRAETLAEGIEQNWQLVRLQAEGCTLGQGPIFSQPIAPEALEAVLFVEPFFS
jgi:diguanylate cyclase (GGDEF)-like protein/PAS domain S-box-containing protein